MHLSSKIQSGLLGRVVSSRWFALTDLFLVVGSGILWILKPEIGVLPILSIALIPWLVWILAGSIPFRGTLFDWLIVIFLVTAWIGYWAAYDREAAWSKIWMIVLAVLLYYALSIQPEENLDWICALLFCTGLGVSIYFFLTHDFVTVPRKLELVNRIGRWVTSVLPRPGWKPIHPNYVAGIAAITTPFILYPIGKLVKKKNLFSSLLLIVSITGIALALISILMATSRGVIMAIASAFGIWVVWRIIALKGSRLKFSREAIFPPLVFIWLFLIVLFIYVGPANSGNALSNGYIYGTGSRGELVSRSLYLLLDFPFTGGGLGSFPGLYSYYILGIPNFYLPNSHNLFLDVAVEQGLLGGMSVLIIFLACIWFTARTIERSDTPMPRIFSWLILFAIIIAFVHGMVDDYLYNGPGTFLLLFLVGLSTAVKPEEVRLAHPLNLHAVGVVTLVLTSFLLINFNRIRSIWNSNIGAVQMAKVELAGFPSNQWTDASILPKIKLADNSLHSALRYDSVNETANYRLGMISMLRRDFNSAAHYLELAYKQVPNHRGIIKTLGYCYVWSGEVNKAQLLLIKIPEARNELETYSWWWGVQRLPKLAEKATKASSKLESVTH